MAFSEAIDLSIEGLDLTTIISATGGVTGIILAAIKIGNWMKKSFTADIQALKVDICSEIADVREDVKEIKADVKEARNDSKETLQKLNEHLVTAEQRTAAVQRLRERVDAQDEALQSLQREISGL
jgi:hypothetical protein